MRGLRDLRGSYPEVGALAGELQSPQAAAADPALARLRAPGPAPAAAASHVASLDDSDRPRGVTRRLRSSTWRHSTTPIVWKSVYTCSGRLWPVRVGGRSLKAGQLDRGRSDS